MFYRNGFVLFYTIWFILIFTIASSFFFLWTSKLLQDSIKEKENIKAEIEIGNTYNRLLYAFSTRTYSYFGLKTSGNMDIDNVLPDGSEIKLDSTVYSGVGDSFFLIQDESGLININFIERSKLRTLLLLLNISEADGMYDKLQDYIDLDSFHRVNGAEKPHYIEQQMLPPTNKFLKSQGEVSNILQWNNEANVLWRDDNWNSLTTTIATSNLPNINTAPNIVLQAIFDINETAAKEIITRRNILPFFHEKMLEEVIGPIAVDPMDMAFFPSDKLRFKLWHKNSSVIYNFSISLLPNSENGTPWEVSSFYIDGIKKNDNLVQENFEKPKIFGE
jgi:hypothetical protein